LNSPHRETAKNVLKKKVKKSDILGLVGSSKVNQIHAGVRHFFLSAPCQKRKTASREGHRKNVQPMDMDLGVYLILAFASLLTDQPRGLTPFSRGAEEKKKKSDVPTYLPFFEIF
jgi:hypothetical protein